MQSGEGSRKKEGLERKRVPGLPIQQYPICPDTSVRERHREHFHAFAEQKTASQQLICKSSYLVVAKEGLCLRVWC